MKKQQSKPRFKIIKDDPNPYNKLIESRVVDKEWVTRFTIAGVENDIARLLQAKTELEAKKQIEEAKIENVKINHPEIDLNIDEKTQIAYTVVQQAKAFIQTADNKLKEIEAQMNEYAADLKEVFRQTGIRLPEVLDVKLGKGKPE